MGKKSPKSIIEEAMPGRIVVDTPASERSAARVSHAGRRSAAGGVSDAGRPGGADAEGPDLAALRAKFLGAAAAPAGESGEPTSDAAEGTDVEVYMTRSARRSSDAAGESDPGAKAVLFSKSKGKIVGYQG